MGEGHCQEPIIYWHRISFALALQDMYICPLKRFSITERADKAHICFGAGMGEGLTKRVMMRMIGRTERTTSQYCHVPHTVLSLNESDATMPAGMAPGIDRSAAGPLTCSFPDPLCSHLVRCEMTHVRRASRQGRGHYSHPLNTHWFSLLIVRQDRAEGSTHRRT
jgi:hypothetical protein